MPRRGITIIFWQDNVTIIADGSKFNSDVYFIVGNCCHSEFDWGKVYYVSDIVELFGNSDDRSTLPKVEDWNELQNVLQLNFYYHIFVIVLLQSFVTVLDNLYIEQFYEQSWGGRLVARLKENHKILPQFSTLVLYLHRLYSWENTVHNWLLKWL